MKGYGHHITGAITGITIALVAARYFEAPSIAAAAAVVGGWVGGTLPDKLEGPAKCRLLPHRTITHWLPLWVVILVACWFPPINTLPEILRMLMYGLVGGAITHILTDWPNPQGIPIKTPFQRHSLNLWRSGENEFFIIAVQAVAAWFVVGGVG